MRAIFISYRRDDTEGQAGRLFASLLQVFGKEMVFMDVAGIAPGVDFRRVIEEKTASCGVLLALIGRNWLAAGPDGRRRLDDANDFVRLETAAALRRDIPVIPVLVQGADMPRPDQLPADLQDLAYRNSVEITHARWDSDVDLLVRALRPLVGSDAPAAAPPAAAAQPTAGPAMPLPALPPPRRKWLVPLTAVVLLLVLAGAWFAQRGGPGTADDSRSVGVPSSRGADAVVAAADPAPAAALRSPVQNPGADDDRAAAQKRLAQLRDHQNGICISGFVWRDARLGDTVCVTPQRRAQAAEENRNAAGTRQPGGGAYGANTCRQGYVWRGAFDGDVVCVVPGSRDQVAADNAAAAQRVVPAPGVPFDTASGKVRIGITPAR